MIWFLLCAILAPQSFTKIVRASASPSSPLSPYESVRALDKYGNAVQLKHAQAAADQHGRLLIVIQRPKQVWVVSPRPSTEHLHHHRVRHDEDDNLLSFLHVRHRDNDAIEPFRIGIVCSGVQPDAIWLIRQLQLFAKAVWERYATQLSSTKATAEAVANLKRLFWGYNDDEKSTWQGSAWRAAGVTSDEQWARPLGVRTILVSARSASSLPLNASRTQVHVVEPSGIVWEGEWITCIGKHSAEVQLALQDRYKRRKGLSDQELEDALVQAVSSQTTAKELIVEIVSSDGSLEKRSILVEATAT